MRLLLFLEENIGFSVLNLLKVFRVTGSRFPVASNKQDGVD